MLSVLIFAALLGLIPAGIAHNKGYSFVGWWFYGAALFIIAFPHSLFLSPDTRVKEQRALMAGGMKKCPFCAELIRDEALVCRYCSRPVHKATTAAAPTAKGVVLREDFGKCPGCGHAYDRANSRKFCGACGFTLT